LTQSSSSDLASDLRAYVGGRRRDSKKESDLLRRLRAVPQQERPALLLPLLELKRRSILVLIHRAQLSPSDYLEVLKRGLNEVKNEPIQFWMDATVPHIGWRKTFSVLRESMATNPRAGAMALYQVPRVCRGKGQLSGSLPTRKLTLECLRLIVHYHENGHRVVADSTLVAFKNILSSYGVAEERSRGWLKRKFKWFLERSVNLSCGNCKAIRSFSGDPPKCDICGWACTPLFSTDAATANWRSAREERREPPSTSSEDSKRK